MTKQTEGEGLRVARWLGVPPKPPLIVIIKNAIPTADAISGIYLEPRGSHKTDPFAEREEPPDESSRE